MAVCTAGTDPDTGCGGRKYCLRRTFFRKKTTIAPAAAPRSDASLFVRPSHDIINAHIVQGRQLNQIFNRDRARPLFVAPVYLALALQMIRHLLLRQIVVNPQILQSFEIHFTTLDYATIWWYTFPKYATVWWHKFTEIEVRIMKRRILALLLCLCMTASLLSGVTVSAFAEDAVAGVPAASENTAGGRAESAPAVVSVEAGDLTIAPTGAEQVLPVPAADEAPAVEDVPLAFPLEGKVAAAERLTDEVESAAPVEIAPTEAQNIEIIPAELNADRSTVLSFLIQLAKMGEYKDGTYHFTSAVTDKGIIGLDYTPGNEVSVVIYAIGSTGTSTSVVSIDPSNAYSTTFDAVLYANLNVGDFTGAAVGLSRSSFSNSTTTISFYYDGLATARSAFNDLFVSSIKIDLDALDTILHQYGGYCIKDIGFSSFKGSNCTGASVPVNGVTMDRSTLSISEGGRASLTATVYPSNATNRTVTWSSDDPSIATVNAYGLVQGVSAGKTSIYAACEGYAAACQVTVSHVHNYSYHEAKAATCTESGWYAYNTCTGCSYTTYQEIPATGHSWNSGAITTASTCTETGVKTYTCTRCGKTKTESVSPHGHSFTRYDSDGNATCVKDGTKTAICDRCNVKNTITDVGSKNNAPHVPDGNLDCTKQTKCTLCGKVIKTAGTHVWDDGKITAVPTCKTVGELTYNCAVCGAVKTESIPVAEHSWDSGTVTTAPTCTAAGVKAFACTVCGNTKTEAVSELGHSWGTEKVVLQQPTLAATGLKAYVCERCGAQKDEETIPVLVPTFTASSVSAQPGKTAAMKLTVKNNPGIAGAFMKLAYAPELELQKITVGDALTGLTFTQPGNLTANPIRLLWDGLEADSSNGTILTLTFEVPAQTPEGDYAVTLSSDAGGIYDGNINDVAFTMVNGKVTVRNTQPGDINGDGILNAKDVTALRRYLAGGYTISVVESLLDVNHDGSLNAKDVTYLRRALAGGYGITLE